MQYGSCNSTTGQCECVSPSDQAFCTSKNTACGPLNDYDSCGVWRQVTSCATCPASQQCANSGVIPDTVTSLTWSTAQFNLGPNGANSYCYTPPLCSLNGSYFGVCGDAQQFPIVGGYLPSQPSIVWSATELEYVVVYEAYDEANATWGLYLNRLDLRSQAWAGPAVQLAPSARDQRRPTIAARQG